MRDIDNHVVKICQAYLFYSLYNKGFLKSKAFTFTENATDLVNKLHHMMKSSVNQAIGDTYNHLFSNVTFSRWNGLSMSVLCDNMYGRSNIFKSRVNVIAANARIGLGPVMRLEVNGPKVRYAFDNIDGIFQPNGWRAADTIVDFQDSLDAIINCIMFIPASVKMIGDCALEVEKIGADYQYTVADIMDFLACISVQGGGQLRVDYNEITTAVNAQLVNPDGTKNEEKYARIVPLDEVTRGAMIYLQGAMYYFNNGADVALMNILNSLRGVVTDNE